MLTLITLGGVTVRGTASRFDASRIRKPLALMAMIAAAGERGMSRDRLQAFFWPESDAEHARGGLKQAQYLVRQALGVDPFSAQGSNVALDPNVIVTDIAQFQQRSAVGELCEAAALYGGPFLDGVYLKDVPEFEHWVDGERARLATMYARTLECLAADAAQRHDHATAADWWRRRAELDRLDARVARLYIEALAAGGDREGAMRHARVYSALVRSELGDEPDPDLLVLAEQVRASPAVGLSPVIRAPSEDRAELSQPIGVTPPQRLPGSRRRLLLLNAGGVAVVSLVGLVTWQRNSGVPSAANKAATLAFQPTTKVPAGVAPTRIDEPEPRRDIGRVLVAPLENESHDSAAASFGRLAADWMATGLGQTGLVDVVDAQTTAALRLRLAPGNTPRVLPPDLRQLAADADARTLVIGRYYSTRDSLVVQVLIDDVGSGQLLRTLPRIAVGAGDYSNALALLRDRIAGAFATIVDPRLESLVDRSTPAPSLAAYQAYSDGLDCFIQRVATVSRVPSPPQCSDAKSLRAAIAADSSWTLPYIWLMYTQRNADNSAAIDSLLGILDRRHQHLSELDRYSVEYFRRYLMDDTEGMLAATRRAAALAPRSNWTLEAANQASYLRRYREALAFLRQLDPERGWVRGLWPYVQKLTWQEHALGDYRAQLRDAEKAEHRNPGRGLYSSFRLGALIGLGDTATVTRVLDSLRTDPPAPHSRLVVILATVMNEAAAHGYPQLAKQIADRCLAIANPATNTTPGDSVELFDRADCLREEGRWAEAKAALESVGEEKELVFVETEMGDSAGAAFHMKKVLARSRHRRADSLYMLAKIAAIQGQKARAVELLRQIPVSVFGPGALHNASFRNLLTYPPARALDAPRG